MQYYQVARIVNTFGIKGQVKVLMDTDFIEERFAEGNRLFILKDGKSIQEVTVQSIQDHKGSYLVKFKEYNNINEVEFFKGLTLAISAQDQQELEEDAYYHHQIIGLSVYTMQNQKLGTIKEIISLGSNDVWVVKADKANQKDILLPFINDVVKEVNLNEGIVRVELMEGLVDES
ncbi:ribosome maturation factor RimM [Facklamia miroungae]|uniref:Ribosome maturation factor RimM n=1 Tax=Facklamia miroungae TaxID=120956 RepID=A0A1G7NX61_9LACT|nr:ribosome maturation factor RimM [Facklamia miroungae]NKZ28500.1 ribosome maturation factor RimM [Facklamia miroungae]SDF78594.1 16S rRNA processing protein RimM [Facklamia miroungae]